MKKEKKKCENERTGRNEKKSREMKEKVKCSKKSEINKK